MKRQSCRSSRFALTPFIYPRGICYSQSSSSLSSATACFLSTSSAFVLGLPGARLGARLVAPLTRSYDASLSATLFSSCERRGCVGFRVSDSVSGLMVVWLLARSGVGVDLGVASVGLVGADSSSESEDQSTSSSSAGVEAVYMLVCFVDVVASIDEPFSISLLRCSSLSIT